MTTYQLLNSIGLFIDIVGVLLVFFNSPVVTYKTYIYKREEEDKFERKAVKKRNLSRIGIGLIGIGFMFQLSGVMLSL